MLPQHSSDSLMTLFLTHYACFKEGLCYYERTYVLQTCCTLAHLLIVSILLPFSVLRQINSNY